MNLSSTFVVSLSSDEVTHLLLDKFLEKKLPLDPNSPVFVEETSETKSLIGIYKNNGIRLVENKNPYKLKSRNMEQAFAIDLIMDPTVPLNLILGYAGTGKTLISTACALEMVFSDKYNYKQIIITKPIEQTGSRRIGDLPGDINEKFEPYAFSFKTAFSHFHKNNPGKTWDNLSHMETIKIVPLQFMRGISFHNSIIIADEMQNADMDELRTLSTRIDHTSKLILMGDTNQIDTDSVKKYNPFEELAYNQTFRKSDLTSVTKLTKIERSPLTKLMIQIFQQIDT